jgi:3-methyl-2-oxobutanoate hydroxymethyltransferase
MRVSISKIADMKRRGEKITMLTAYDYTTAKLVDEAGIPLILVGDSLGMVLLGYDSTIPVTIEEMLHHTRAVTRGTRDALVVGDMPFMTYYSKKTALQNAARFIQEGGAQAVKLEGGVSMAGKVHAIVECGIPVMGHIGLTPQAVNQLGGYKVQGKTIEAARALVADALALQQAGAFAVVLEMVPAALAAHVTRQLEIPTIGIGAGADCDGQVQVINDILGSFTDFVPKHAKQYANLAAVTREAVSAYHDEVTQGVFPTASHSTELDPTVLRALEEG